MYAHTVTEKGVPVVVAANGPGSLASALQIGGGWVTTGGYGITGPEKEQAVNTLLAEWRLQGGHDAFVLIDPFEASPWSSENAFRTTISTWSAMGIDELVLWDPASYRVPATLTYSDAAALLQDTASNG